MSRRHEQNSGLVMSDVNHFSLHFQGGGGGPGLRSLHYNGLMIEILSVIESFDCF